jgi:uncharacterized protein DUF2721
MENLELLIPLTYIPGVALLIISTSNRYIHLSDNISRYTPEQCRVQAKKVKQELRRAHLFRNSLIGFYLSIVFFSLGSLVAFLTNSWGIETSKTILETASIIGVGLIVFSVISLSYESILTLNILKRHARGDREDDSD